MILQGLSVSSCCIIRHCKIQWLRTMPVLFKYPLLFKSFWLVSLTKFLVFAGLTQCLLLKVGQAGSVPMWLILFIHTFLFLLAYISCTRVFHCKILRSFLMYKSIWRIQRMQGIRGEYLCDREHLRCIIEGEIEFHEWGIILRKIEHY